MKKTYHDKIIDDFENLIADLYYLPSHNRQTIYVRIYPVKSWYKLLYAKPRIYNFLVNQEIYMYRFSNTLKTENAKIICGYKNLRKELFDNIAKEENLLLLEKSRFFIDEERLIIRYFHNKEIYRQIVVDDIENHKAIKTFMEEIL
ncbi:MAG: hypothetical protein IJU14_07555 [Clostridia bacterium]|nr:hypothetical protein [Clostridia bacterium]